MLVRWTSTVLCVTKSACAISRFVGPAAAISATRRSLGVSDSTPLRAMRRGRAAVGSAERRSQLGARLGVLELRRGTGQHLHRFLEQGEPAAAALDQSSYTK